MFRNTFWFWEAELPKDVCERTIQNYFDPKQIQTAGYNDKDGVMQFDEQIRKTEICWATPESEIFNVMIGYILGANKSAEWNLDLTGMEEVQIGRYVDSGFYNWHIDGDIPDKGNYQRKLSCSIQLSDPDSYEGGDIILRTPSEEYTVPRAQGTVVVFPSFVSHKVTPVTKGERYSAVSWMRGPAFK